MFTQREWTMYTVRWTYVSASSRHVVTAKRHESTLAQEFIFDTPSEAMRAAAADTAAAIADGRPATLHALVPVRLVREADVRRVGGKVVMWPPGTWIVEHWPEGT